MFIKGYSIWIGTGILHLEISNGLPLNAVNSCSISCPLLYWFTALNIPIISSTYTTTPRWLSSSARINASGVKSDIIVLCKIGLSGKGVVFSFLPLLLSIRLLYCSISNLNCLTACASCLRIGRKAKSKGGVLPVPGRPINII